LTLANAPRRHKVSIVTAKIFGSKKAGLGTSALDLAPAPPAAEAALPKFARH
jgi:hypothetical protein